MADKYKEIRSCYYETPEPLASFMVKSIIQPYLNEKFGEIDKKYKDKPKKKVFSYIGYQNVLESLRVCDLCCGEGVFLEQAYKYLYDKVKRSQDLVKKVKKEVTLFDEENFIQGVLADNLYGIDVDEARIKKTKQRIMGLTNAKIADKILNNVRVGDAIISDQNLVSDLAFDWDAEFGETFFDVVISNPPWTVVKHSELSSSQLDYIRENYVSSHGFKINLFPLFLERAIKVAKPGGFISFIMPSRFLDTPSYKYLRKFILDNTKILRIIEMPEGCFKGVIAGNIILELKKEKVRGLHEFEFFKAKVEGDSFKLEEEGLKIDYDSIKKHEEYKIHSVSLDKNSEILEKIEEKSEKLGKYFNIHVGMMVRDKKNVFKEKKDAKNKDKIVAGKSFEPFHIRNVFYFNKDKAQIYGGTKDPRKHGFTPKIIARKTGDKLVCALDKEGVSCEQSVYLLIPKSKNTDLFYTLGLLNSNLITFYYRQKLITNPNTYPYIQQYDFENMPYVAETEYKEKISGIVKEIIKKKDKKRDVRKLEKKIDTIMSKLFDIKKDDTVSYNENI